jgi:hypothetical protein
MLMSPRRVLSGITAAALVVAIGSSYPVTSAGAVTPTGPVKVVPATFTPWLDRSHPNQNVQQLAQCGGTMYAVGTISAVDQGKSSYVRHNAFSFAAATGAVTSWAPNVNGSVHSIALSPDCTTAYLGGAFSSVGGAAAKNLAAVNTTTGALQSSFAHSASAEVDTLQYTHGVVLAGGQFSSINGVSRSRLASLNPGTGAVTGYANLSISGTYPGYGTKVYNSQLSHSGSKLLIEGVFTSIAGQARQQVAVLDLGSTSVTLDGWHALELNQACSTAEAFYAKGANWSPDDGTIYIATTGYRGPTGANTALCDAAAAFPATPTVVTHVWINYTGCDSLYSVAADSDDVYVGGHERWANNGHGCDAAGIGAVARPGIGGLDPLTGLATSWNPTRSRGHGAQDLLITAAGLWVGSDTFTSGTEQMCGRQTNHGGICFLPY